MGKVRIGFTVPVSRMKGGREVRRAAVLRITGEALLAVFREGDERHFAVERGVPRDAKVVGSQYAEGIWDVVLESESFAEIPEGAEPPVLEPPVLVDLSPRPPPAFAGL